MVDNMSYRNILAIKAMFNDYRLYMTIPSGNAYYTQFTCPFTNTMMTNRLLINENGPGRKFVSLPEGNSIHDYRRHISIH